MIGATGAKSFKEAVRMTAEVRALYNDCACMVELGEGMLDTGNQHACMHVR